MVGMEGDDLSRPDQRMQAALPAWNLEETIPERFDNVVKAQPEVLAYVGREASLSYRQVNNHANRLACRIVSTIGEMPARIGLVLDNGAHLFVAAMASLKAGKCYVPLDPAVPAERLREYVRLTGVTCLVTDDRHSDIANQLNEAGLPLLSAEFEECDDDIEGPTVAINLEAEAFVVMTSGSTGAPKGVLHGHLGTLHNTMVTAREFGLNPGDGFLSMFTPAVFGGQRDIFLGLLTGVTTHFISVREVGFAGVGSYIEENRLVGLTSVLTMFRRILDTLTGDEDLSSLRFVTCGGEPLYWTDVRRAYKFIPQTCRIRGGLTMSEGNMITNTWYGPDSSSSSDRVPLGVPADDKIVELRKEDGSLASPGEVGEIFVTSKFISLGYLNAPEEIARRFKTNLDGTRTFATGDLARLDDEGQMVIVGRADHQIKLRGYRVDLSEVEMCISLHPNVAECVVKVHQLPDKPDQLVAYLRMKNEGTFSVHALREYVSQKLSSYMVPSHFVLLQHIPQTASGKVNRQALTMPEEVSREGLGDFAEPRNELDEWLVSIWESWIGVKGISIDDDFFDVGGDSLSATQLIMQIDETYHAEIDAEAMLNTCNTVRKMSDHLSTSAKASNSNEDGKTTSRDINFVDGDANIEATNRPELFRLDQTTGLRIGKPHAVMGKIELNNLGFRGPDLEAVKPAGRIRIAFVGSSTVFDPAVSSNEDTWPHLVIENLKGRFPDREFDYVNAGLPGYATTRSQRLFENYVAPLAPDIVVIQTGDMNRDANYLARAQGLFDGVAYKPSRLARRSRIVMLLEKNSILALRQIRTLMPGRKLRFGDDMANDFQKRLKDLIATCQESGRLVLLLECQRLRETQSLWQKVTSLSSYCLYMPYMSLEGFLRAQALYRAARKSAAEETNCLFYDATDEMPPDGKHYADTSHFRDLGSRRFAGLVASRLAEDPEFVRCLKTDS